MQTEKKKETARVIKFVLFSASAGIIETLAMILCEEILKIPAHWLCYAIALVLSVLWNFTFNRKFTFQSAANVPPRHAFGVSVLCTLRAVHHLE